MDKNPTIMFIVDLNKESIAVKEAKKLGIPIVAIVDTNCDPDGIQYPVPGNDDAGRAIALYCDLIARAAIDGISRSQGSSGMDLGALEAPIEEALRTALEPPVLRAPDRA
jgi:small subunit ribosomal protein S2